MYCTGRRSYQRTLACVDCVHQGQIEYRSRIENWRILWVTSPDDSTALSQCSYIWPAELRNLHSQTCILEMLVYTEFLIIYLRNNCTDFANNNLRMSLYNRFFQGVILAPLRWILATPLSLLKLISYRRKITQREKVCEGINRNCAQVCCKPLVANLSASFAIFIG